MVKKETTANLRIYGVVKAMNQARERLSQGIPVAEQDSFRAWVRSMVNSVEQICQKYKLSPEQLAAPTFRAYQVLKDLDLENLPVLTSDQPAAGKKIRITNLVAICNALQTQMTGLVNNWVDKAAKISLRDPEIKKFHQRIQDHLSRIERIFQQSSSTPAELPAQSRRAYQWLRFLCQEDNLYAHLTGLQRGLEASSKAACRSRLPVAHRNLPVKLEFFHLPALYRTRLEKGTLHIVASEGFIAAHQTVIDALVCSALQGRKSSYLSKVRQFAETDAFSRILVALERGDETNEDNVHGHHFDLSQVFDRVNAEYFGGQIERPRLTWNKTITHRKLGHYQSSTDTVMISITLDQPQIPAFVIDFVMYHELLHKEIGIQLNNGRHYAHTPAFRKRERQFRKYAEAEEFLKQLGEKLAL